MLRRLCLFSLCLVLVGGVLRAQSPTLDLTLLSLDDRAYPQVTLYFRAESGPLSLPADSFSAADFELRLDNGTLAPITNLSAGGRPLHLIVLMDITGSVDGTEIANQEAAISALGRGLRVEDELGLVTMDDRNVRLLAEPSTNRASVLAAFEAIRQRQDAQGNVFWDGVYNSLEALGPPRPDLRRALILMTDASAGNFGGEQSPSTTLALAQSAQIEIFSLYFDHEGDGLPRNPPEIPAELQTLSDGAGGYVFAGTGETFGAEYSDDAALPRLMEGVLTLLRAEIRLTATFSAPATTFTLTHLPTGTSLQGTLNAGLAIAPSPTPLPSATPAPTATAAPANEAPSSQDRPQETAFPILALLGALGALLGLGLLGGTLWLRGKGARPRPALPPAPPTEPETPFAWPHLEANPAPLIIPPPTPLGPPLAAFIPVQGGERWLIYAGQNTLGRGAENSLQIKDPAVSRQHAVLQANGQTFRYWDTHASHVSEINGTLLPSNTYYDLQEGDVLRVGSVLLRFTRRL